MRKQHHAKLKFHAIYSIAIATILVAVLVFVRDLTLGIATALLLAYVAGNGIIHTKHNILSRDTLVEYVLVSLVVIIVITGTFL